MAQAHPRFDGDPWHAYAMDIWSAQPTDTRPLFAEERRDLLDLLEDLPASDWTRATPAEGWSVKDLALHLLDGDLGRLSRDRDGDTTGLLPVDVDGSAFAEALAAKNQRWIAAARQLSPRVIQELLLLSTGLVHEWTSSADLFAPTRVSWASDEEVPGWLDLAREFTETWAHHQQIRIAAGYAPSTLRLPTVLRTFVWALPHQYRVAAEPSTVVLVDLDTGGQWHLLAQGAGRWTLEEGLVSNPAASLRFTSDAAWRSFTGAEIAPDTISTTGPTELTNPLLGVRGIIA